jgi:hypothetical protein
MATMHTRHRRLLSMDRRGGIQLPPDVADGVSQRHAQGWRDLNLPSESLDAGAGIIHALVLALAVWIFIGLAVVGAVALLG